MIRITERSNELTEDIDMRPSNVTANGGGGDAASLEHCRKILRLLRQSDSQLFNGYKSFGESLLDKSILESLLALSQNFVVAEQTTRVIFSGCGTSGRLSHFCAKNYNHVLAQLSAEQPEKFNNIAKNLHFDYTIAGSDKALVKSQESAEDKPELGIQDLQKLLAEESVGRTDGSSRLVFVGITCGLSAPYVAGQLVESMKTPNSTTVLLGFNPVSMARDSLIPGWLNGTESFLSVTQRLETAAKTDPLHNIIINPVVGPESITGSTRMKGGSATKILLDAAFATAVLAVQLGLEKPTKALLFDVLAGFEDTRMRTYASLDSIAEVMNLAQKSLNAGGHVYYLGCSNAGILGFIDASECPPTYGANFSDVRGFLQGGWQEFGNHDRDVMEQSDDSDFRISTEHFVRHFVPTLTSRDTVIFLGIESQLSSQSGVASIQSLFDVQLPAEVERCWVWIKQTSVSSPVYSDIRSKVLSAKTLLVEVELHHISAVTGLDCYAEFALKLVLNAVTTGAHVMKGMTFGNRMINLRVSNNKLYFRAIGIVSSIMGVSEERAEECILEAIYHGAAGGEAAKKMNTVEQHISVAITKPMVVPTALLLASGSCKTVEEAATYLSQDPIVRNIIQAIRSGTGNK